MVPSPSKVLSLATLPIGSALLPAGSYDVAVAPAGADAADAVIEATLDLEGGVNYNVAAVGSLPTSRRPSSRPTPLIWRKVRPVFRLFTPHLTPRRVKRAVAGGPVLVGDLSFPNASGSLDVDSGTYDLEVRPAGTEDVALDLPGVALDAGTVYDILAIGTLADGTLTVLPLTTPGEVADGVGGVTDVAATGVGSAVQGSTGMLMLLAAVAAVVLYSRVRHWSLRRAAASKNQFREKRTPGRSCGQGFHFFQFQKGQEFERNAEPLPYTPCTSWAGTSGKLCCRALYHYATPGLRAM